MPPEVEKAPIPTGRGRDAQRWMEYHGYVDTTPSIRSSDYEGVLHCPFQYYLSRRLNLSPALRWSKALSRGSWFHRRLELYKDTPKVASLAMEKMLQDRLEELEEICQSIGIKGESKDKVMEREKRDFWCALGWYETALHLETHQKIPTVHQFLSQSHFKHLDSEAGIRLHMPHTHKAGKVMLTGMYDILLYHEPQNTVFIVDAKTTAGDPQDRLLTCPLEFQTQHYMMILKIAIENNLLQSKYDLPEDVGVGGMIHIAVQKPTIDFGMKDRDFEEVEHILQRGPRKGQTEVRRNYIGEPRFDNYIARCNDWYRGQGEYLHNAEKWAMSPPINYSLTYGSLLSDKDYVDEYYSRVSLIRQYVQCKAIPKNFPRSISHLRQFGRMSPYTPFYMTPPKEWPDIIQAQSFMQVDRDEDVRFVVDASINTT
ncbi:TPA: PD-(D/E)XK nuclease family protein [Candidatus Woesearchaeota archaeon]|nr:PD-(D/E)XK nuclease family protein [Candidatus Woesearchaeota archaeon]